MNLTFSLILIIDSIAKKIEEQKFLENSVPVGEGEENLTNMPDGFREWWDYEQYFFTKNNLD